MATENSSSSNSGERMLISCDPDKCDGCGICELVCSHIKEGNFNPSLSRIRTMRLHHVANIAIACRHCEDPSCVKACAKSEALKIENHILVCDREKCNLCGWCVDACPFGTIFLDSRAEKLCAVMCDLCIHDRIDGEPPCVKYCPKEALSLESAKSMAQKAKGNIIYTRLSELETETPRKGVIIVEK